MVINATGDYAPCCPQMIILNVSTNNFNHTLMQDENETDCTEENDLMSGPSRDIISEYSQENFTNMSNDDSVPKIPKTFSRWEKTSITGESFNQRSIKENTSQGMTLMKIPLSRRKLIKKLLGRNRTMNMIITRDRILMQMHISFLQPESILVWIYV
jgi:hypothetical protein